MKNKKKLQFDLLGAFAGREAGNGQIRDNVVPDRVGKKVLMFLQYMIVNHGRNISSEELIGQFWSEDKNSDPANSLKNMLFKTRSLLKTMFPDQKNLIMTLQGCYAWTSSVQIVLDSEEFEQMCLEARKQNGKDDLEMLLRALTLYKGDFLSGNDSSWAVSQRRYYQILYLDACRMILPLLQEQERWTEMINICESASNMESGSDSFVVYQMQALISMEHPERAIEIYETFRRTLWEEFEIEPTEQVEQMHILAESMCQNNTDTLDIMKLVAEGEIGKHAFLCTFGVFQSIVALERRHLMRSGRDTALVVVSLGSKVASTTDARRLERILLEGLRTGDPVARLDTGSYILMLTDASAENARAVMERIDRMFHKLYSHSRACISYQISSLEQDKVRASCS